MHSWRRKKYYHPLREEDLLTPAKWERLLRYPVRGFIVQKTKIDSKSSGKAEKYRTRRKISVEGTDGHNKQANIPRRDKKQRSSSIVQSIRCDIQRGQYKNKAWESLVEKNNTYLFY